MCGNLIVTPTTAKLLAWEFKGETYFNGDDDVAEGGMACEMAGWPEWLLTYCNTVNADDNDTF